jgi:hypothetical protein
LQWDNIYNPFILLMVISIFNIVRNIKFESKVINYVSKQSLFIYIIHENLILRTYYRPMMWHYVYTNFGYNYILGWTFVITILVFTFGFLTSVVYSNTIQIIIKYLTDKIYPQMVKFYGFLEKRFLQLR